MLHGKEITELKKPMSYLLKNDSLQVIVKTDSFFPGGHKIEKNKEGFVVKIDGKEPKGTDGNLPKVGMTYLSLRMNGKDVFIPSNAYKDLFEPGIATFNVYFDKKGTIYLYMPFNSDGAGGYFVAWAIKDGKYLKRYVDSP
jgi:hypothetical protein